MEDLYQSLKNNGGLKGEVLIDEATLHKYSRDASIFEVAPSCVVKPKDTLDIQNLVKWVAENKSRDEKLSITARAAGTDMSGGPLNESIIADFTAHFNKIEMFGIYPTSPAPRLRLGVPSPTPGEGEIDGFAVVEPGVFYRDFEVESLKRGLILPCYTASKSLNTIGGMAANNSAGEKSLSFGQMKDYVEELNVVLSDGNEYVFGELDNNQLEQKLKLPGFEGEIYRQMFRLVKENSQLIQNAKPTTSKNAAGYLLWEVYDGVRFNLAKLIVGSQGTLGLITKIKVKLVKPKPKSGLLVIFMKDLEQLGEVVDAIVGFKPESFESFDDHTFKLAMRFLPDMVKRMGGSLLSLGWQFLPELWMTLTGGVPKLILIAEFTGTETSEIHERLLAAQKVMREKFKLKTHLTKTEEEAQKYWTVRRESFNLLRQHSRGLATAPFIDDIVVHPADLPQFLPELNQLLAKYPSLIYTIAGHMGDANFHIIPLMDLSRADRRMIIPKLADQVYNLVLKYKGSITAEHNDGLIRSPFLEKQFGPEIVRLFSDVKRIFDPNNIFNPGKKINASMDYAIAHIKKA